MTNSDLKQFIEKYKKLIDNREYEEVFAQALLKFGTSTGKLTELLYRCGVDPLKYISKVPNTYACESSIKSIVIPSNIVSIGNNAFEHCTSLTSVTIGDSVTSIGDGVFSGCTSLTSVIIPDSMPLIGWKVFNGCSSLKSINYKGSKNQWNNITKIQGGSGVLH